MAMCRHINIQFSKPWYYWPSSMLTAIQLSSQYSSLQHQQPLHQSIAFGSRICCIHNTTHQYQQQPISSSSSLSSLSSSSSSSSLLLHNDTTPSNSSLMNHNNIFRYSLMKNKRFFCTSIDNAKSSTLSTKSTQKQKHKPKFFYMSYSRLRTFQTCPKQYEFRYEKREKRAPESGRAMAGSAIHDAVATFADEREKRRLARRKRKRNQVDRMKRIAAGEEVEDESDDEEEKKIDEVAESLRVLKKNWKSNLFSSEAESTNELKQAEKLFRDKHMTCMQDDDDEKQEELNDENALKVSVEKTFQFHLADDVKFVGSFDRVELLPPQSGKSSDERDIVLYEFKTHLHDRQIWDVQYNLQLRLYSAAVQSIHGKLPTRVFLQEIGSMKKAIFLPRPTEIDETLRHTMDAASKMRSSSSRFEATPGYFKCKMCPFREKCDDKIVGHTYDRRWRYQR